MFPWPELSHLLQRPSAQNEFKIVLFTSLQNESLVTSRQPCEIRATDVLLQQQPAEPFQLVAES